MSRIDEKWKNCLPNYFMRGLVIVCCNWFKDSNLYHSRQENECESQFTTTGNYEMVRSGTYILTSVAVLWEWRILYASSTKYNANMQHFKLSFLNKNSLSDLKSSKFSLNVFKGGIRKMVCEMRAVYEKENIKIRTSMKNHKDLVSSDYRKHLELRCATGTTCLYCMLIKDLWWWLLCFTTTWIGLIVYVVILTIPKHPYNERNT